MGRLRQKNVKLIQKWTRHAIATSISMLSFLCFVVIAIIFIKLVRFQLPNSSESLAENNVFGRCSYSDFMRPAQLATDGAKSMPLHVTDFLQEIDHVFLICLHQCRTRLPSEVSNRSTQVLGSLVDSCAPTRLISGKYAHALKVTFTHAVIIQRASEMRYRHIAVIEDDVLFLQQDAHKEMMTGFTQLVNSQKWNLLRFGYRPYFLQEYGAQPCPVKCQCISDKMFSEHFCHLRSTGCDLRSSDFYVISARSFKTFKNMLLDIRLPDTKRIVDVYPMKAISNQWLIVPQLSFQGKLDIPLDFQVGSSALFVKKCLHPRPLPNDITAQLSRSHIWKR